MHLLKSRVFRAAGLGVGLALSASLALAGQGTFTLPMEAHIGNITLSPGDYTIITPIAGTPVRVVYLYADGRLKATLPLTVGNHPDSGSYLKLVNVGGTYFIQRYNAGVAGEEFTFDIPKKFRHQAAADIRAASLPVAGEGK